MARFGLYTELKLDESFRQHGTEAGALNLTLGFEPIKKLSVAFNWKPTLTLYNNNDVKTYFSSPDVIGGSIGYRVFRQKNGTRYVPEGQSLDIRTSINSTLGGNDLKFTSYDVGLYYYQRKSVSAPVTGIGFRHTSYHTPGIQDTYCVFIECGFRF